MSDQRLEISPKFRVGLAVKGLALLAFGLALGWLCWSFAVAPDLHLAIRLPFAVVFGVSSLFLVSVSRLAFADAALGKALRVQGAEALASRKAGYSLRLPSGRFAEYLLWNPWEQLVAGRRYTVTLGERSLVMVAPPVPEDAPPAA